VLNPQWGVPKSIIEKEYFTQIATNAHKFLEKEAMMILDSKGNKVNVDSVDWKKIKPDKFPYLLVQHAERNGALGIIKFYFPNPCGVYLHDTPSKSAFNFRNRAVSHGCVRVEKPMELAQLIFDFNKFDDAKIEKILIDLGEKPKTKVGEKYVKEKEEKETKYYEKLSPAQKEIYYKKRPSYVTLTNKLPVYIEYYTCFADENGEVNYRNDVYYRDKNILRLLGSYEL
jgi:murein L,D-transpeptidase YcbB/YkuD